MQKRMTKQEGRAFKARWKAVNAAEIEELQRTSPAYKLRQLTTLMGWVEYFAWAQALAEGEAEVRERWNRLRRIYGG